MPILRLPWLKFWPFRVKIFIDKLANLFLGRILWRLLRDKKYNTNMKWKGKRDKPSSFLESFARPNLDLFLQPCPQRFYYPYTIWPFVQRAEGCQALICSISHCHRVQVALSHGFLQRPRPKGQERQQLPLLPLFSNPFPLEVKKRLMLRSKSLLSAMYFAVPLVVWA